MKRLMQGPAGEHPSSYHYGVHAETPYCSKGADHIQCKPLPTEEDSKDSVSFPGEKQ